MIRYYEQNVVFLLSGVYRNIVSGTPLRHQDSDLNSDIANDSVCVLQFIVEYFCTSFNYVPDYKTKCKSLFFYSGNS